MQLQVTGFFDEATNTISYVAVARWLAGRKGALNVAFAGLIFVVAAYMLVKSAASFA